MRNKGFGAESEEIKVESIRFVEILKKFGCPYYLKIDVEGADMLCVNALKDFDCRINISQSNPQKRPGRSF